MACATMVAGPTWFTVEPIRKVMFALLGERASAGAAMAAPATTTVAIPMRILHLRIGGKRTPAAHSNSRRDVPLGSRP